LRRFSATFGVLEALRFEIAWTLRTRELAVRVPGLRMPPRLRRGSSDIHVFESVFVDREFDGLALTSPRLIIDGGANVGYTTAFFAYKYPGAMVIAVEPSSDNARQLELNCRGLGNVRVLVGGIWPVSGYLRIANPMEAAWALQCEPAGAEEPGAFRAYTVDEIIDGAGEPHCDLLKLDIEGAEEQLFSGPTGWLARVGSIVVEVHGARAREEIDRACPPQSWERRSAGEKILLTGLRGAA
jgi:FkbM family methyltransferase